MNQLIFLGGQKIDVVGYENIPKDEPVLYVSNHQGSFDIPFCMTQLHGLKGFIVKKEMNKVPIMRNWIEHMGCVFIDRKNPRNSMNAILKGIESLKNGNSLILFPEGTRSKDGALAKFKPGSLKLATKSGVKVVPVTINGSINSMLKGSIRIKPNLSQMIISKPIIIEGEMKDSIKLTKEIKRIIQENLTT